MGLQLDVLRTCLGMTLERRRAEGEGERPSPVTAFHILGPGAPEVGSWVLLLDC